MFGENLKAARAEKGYTLEQLANHYNSAYGGGLSKGTLSKYENGKQEPMISVVANLSAVLNVSTDYLLGRDTIAQAGIDPEKIRNRERIIRMLDQLSEERQRVIENLIALEWNQKQQK
ncbi:MAG: helix-turn-helix domain-containing protein [Oscillospiraceae bacterium]|nr:helix-turn-helix domain-containing protein [Oscillospiraceae bacterium]MDD4414041.1 helix-turn-helix domain-containing protein [Oscillospiraceae bacterium]